MKNRPLRIGVDVGILMTEQNYGVPVYVESLVRRLLEKGREDGADIASLRLASEAPTQKMRQRLTERGLFAEGEEPAREVSLHTGYGDEHRFGALVGGAEGSTATRLAAAVDRRLLRGLSRRLTPEWRKCEPLVDVFHHTDYMNPYWAQMKGPHVVTVHDLIPFRFPNDCSPGWAESARRTRDFVRERGAQVITYSESSKRDMAEFWDLPSHQVTVIPLAVRESLCTRVSEGERHQVLERFGLQSGRFIFALGRIDPLKNLRRLIEAFASVQAEPDNGDIRLVLAGPTSTAARDAARFDPGLIAEQCGVGDRVVRTGYLKEKEVTALMQTCSGFAYPTLYEGFGLPLLEAMRLGAPVVAADVSSVPEVVGDAALLIDPYNVDELAHALLRLLRDEPLRREMIEKGKRRVAQFSWGKVVNAHMSVYQKAADVRP